MADVNWVKSSLSGKQGNCVVVTKKQNEIWVGHSKMPGEILARYTLAEWNAFLGGVALGEFKPEKL
jgi:hypothetical protein